MCVNGANMNLLEENLQKLKRKHLLDVKNSSKYNSFSIFINERARSVFIVFYIN